MVKLIFEKKRRIQHGSKFETTDYLYENGILDYVGELAGEEPLTAPFHDFAASRNLRRIRQLLDGFRRSGRTEA